MNVSAGTLFPECAEVAESGLRRRIANPVCESTQGFKIRPEKENEGVNDAFRLNSGPNAQKTLPE